jgi:hypothetical protein
VGNKTACKAVVVKHQTYKCMTAQHNQPALSAGCCPNAGDGDTGTRVWSATCEQEACSLNNTADSLPGTRSDLARPVPTQQLGPEAPPPNSGSALTGGGAPSPNTGSKIRTAQTQSVNDGQGVNGEQNKRGNQAPPTQGTSTRGGAKTKPTLRAGTKIVSLNMKGYGNELSHTDIVSEKWKHILPSTTSQRVQKLFWRFLALFGASCFSESGLRSWPSTKKQKSKKSEKSRLWLRST